MIDDEELPELGDDFLRILRVRDSSKPQANDTPMRPKQLVAMYVAVMVYKYEERFLVPEEVAAVGEKMFGEGYRKNHKLLPKFENIEHPVTEVLREVDSETMDRYKTIIDGWFRTVLQEDPAAKIRAKILRGLKGRLPVVEGLLYKNFLVIRKRRLEDWEYCLTYALARYYVDDENNFLTGKYIAQLLATAYKQHLETILRGVVSHVATLRNDASPAAKAVKEVMEVEVCDEWVRLAVDRVFRLQMMEDDGYASGDDSDLAEDTRDIPFKAIAPVPSFTSPHLDAPNPTEPEETSEITEAEKPVGFRAIAPAPPRSSPYAPFLEAPNPTDPKGVSEVTQGMSTTSLSITAPPVPVEQVSPYSSRPDAPNPTEPKGKGKGKGKEKEKPKRSQEELPGDKGKKYRKPRGGAGGAGAGSSSTGRA